MRSPTVARSCESLPHAMGGSATNDMHAPAVPAHRAAVKGPSLALPLCCGRRGILSSSEQLAACRYWVVFASMAFSALAFATVTFMKPMHARAHGCEFLNACSIWTFVGEYLIPDVAFRLILHCITAIYNHCDGSLAQLSKQVLQCAMCICCTLSCVHAARRHHHGHRDHCCHRLLCHGESLTSKHLTLIPCSALSSALLERLNGQLWCDTAVVIHAGCPWRQR